MLNSLLLSLIVLVLVSSPAAQTISDCNVLGDFYRSMTVNTEWTISTGWLTTNDCCTWYGVTCVHSATNGTDGPWVSELQLPSNQLSGYFPSTFSQLSRLQRLDLSHNKIKGGISVLLQMSAQSRCIDSATSHIPDSVFLSPCTQDLNCVGGVCSLVGGLTEVRLQDNMLNGSIPEGISSLFKTLTILDLSVNELTGPIPKMIGTLTQLVELNLCYNQLSGPIPEMIGMLVKLKYLNVAFNLLNGTIPSQMVNLQRLEQLDLSVNRFNNGIPPDMGVLVYPSPPPCDYPGGTCFKSTIQNISLDDKGNCNKDEFTMWYVMGHKMPCNAAFSDSQWWCNNCNAPYPASPTPLPSPQSDCRPNLVALPPTPGPSTQMNVPATVEVISYPGPCLRLVILNRCTRQQTLYVRML